MLGSGSGEWGERGRGRAAHLGQQRLAALNGAPHRCQLDGIGDDAADEDVLEHASPGAADERGGQQRPTKRRGLEETGDMHGDLRSRRQRALRSGATSGPAASLQAPATD